jgi:hypothetical protein
MLFKLPTNQVPFTLLTKVVNNTSEPIVICVDAFDPRKPKTFYYRRKVRVVDEFPFDLKFPITPKVLGIKIYNAANGNSNDGRDNSFKVTQFEPTVLKKNPIWLSNEDQSFINFAQEFAENASILASGVRKPAIYRSNDANFEIDYYDKILDKQTGQEENTPARIGHKSGIIEVSKSDFIEYTVPMRVIILLHEYSHKWKNPKIGRPVEDEVSADINALSMYLSLGYSEVEAIRAFATVFKNADNKMNQRRMLILTDFVKKFNEGYFGNNITSYREVVKK